MLYTAIGNLEKAVVHLVASMELAKEDTALEHDVGMLAKASLVLLWDDKDAAKEKQIAVCERFKHISIVSILGRFVDDQSVQR